MVKQQKPMKCSHLNQSNPVEVEINFMMITWKVDGQGSDEREQCHLE